MKFTQHTPGGLNLIRNYGKDFVTVGEQEIRASCIVGAHELIRDWSPRDVASLKLEHLAPLFERKPCESGSRVRRSRRYASLIKLAVADPK